MPRTCRVLGFTRLFLGDAYLDLGGRSLCLLGRFRRLLLRLLLLICVCVCVCVCVRVRASTLPLPSTFCYPVLQEHCRKQRAHETAAKGA